MITKVITSHLLDRGKVIISVERGERTASFVRSVESPSFGRFERTIRNAQMTYEHTDPYLRKVTRAYFAPAKNG